MRLKTTTALLLMTSTLFLTIGCKVQSSPLPEDSTPPTVDRSNPNPDITGYDLPQRVFELTVVGNTSTDTAYNVQWIIYGINRKDSNAPTEIPTQFGHEEKVLIPWKKVIGEDKGRLITTVEINVDIVTENPESSAYCFIKLNDQTVEIQHRLGDGKLECKWRHEFPSV